MMGEHICPGPGAERECSLAFARIYETDHQQHRLRLTHTTRDGFLFLPFQKSSLECLPQSTSTQPVGGMTIT